jgi:hypothetical protein
MLTSATVHGTERVMYRVREFHRLMAATATTASASAMIETRCIEEYDARLSSIVPSHFSGPAEYACHAGFST